MVSREKAALGALISFDQPTKPMRAEAASLRTLAAIFSQPDSPENVKNPSPGALAPGLLVCRCPQHPDYSFTASASHSWLG